jgi:predicted DNA-binding transcriptional regulator YafY
MAENTHRAIRLLQIQHHVRRHPEGLTTRELAGKCGVGVRTIQRDLLALQADLHVPFVEKGFDRYGLPDDYPLPPVSLTLYEAVGLFLAARLVIRQTDEYNPHIHTALAGLASILPIPIAGRLTQSIDGLAGKAKAPGRVKIFEKVAIAWSTRRRIRFRYRSLNGKKTKQWTIEPYFIEMTGTGYSVYVMGNVVQGDREGIITFKLDRMSDVELLEESFEMLEGIGLDDLLGSSWGVIWGEEVEVRLRFSPRVTRRVKESVWHASQRIEDRPDGGCVMTLRVGSTLEMTPWIRGWGADVEVLEPASLRDQFKEWAVKLGNIYR